jgi:hypothetical protein
VEVRGHDSRDEQERNPEEKSDFPRLPERADTRSQTIASGPHKDH